MPSTIAMSPYTSTVAMYMPMICERRAPTSFITPICGICWVISAEMAFTTRNPDSTRIIRPNEERIKTMVPMKGSAMLSVITSRR
jgi:hypothetical protein